MEMAGSDWRVPMGTPGEPGEQEPDLAEVRAEAPVARMLRTSRILHDPGRGSSHEGALRYQSAHRYHIGSPGAMVRFSVGSSIVDKGRYIFDLSNRLRG